MVNQIQSITHSKSLKSFNHIYFRPMKLDTIQGCNGSIEVMHAATNATVIITPIITMYVELLAVKKL